MNFSINFSIFSPKIAGVREILFDISKIYILSHKKEKKNFSFLTEKRLEITKIEFRTKIHQKKKKFFFQIFFIFLFFALYFKGTCVISGF